MRAEKHGRYAFTDRTSDIVIDLDPAESQRQKAQRLYQLNAIQIPLLRFFGFGVITLLVYLYNLYIPPAFSWSSLASFATAMLAYCGLSWGILYYGFQKTQLLDLGVLFMIVDIFFLNYALYYSGGERSWLFLILMCRAADQASIHFKRVVLMAHLTPLGYLGLLIYLAYGEHRPIVWPTEWLKIISLYTMNMYIASTARTATILRKKMSAAIHLAKSCILQLEEKSAHLEVAIRQGEEAHRAKHAFLANMSHELRTPLNAILGYSEMLYEDAVEQGNEAYAQDLQKIQQAGKHLLTLISNILELSTIEAGDTQVRRDTFAVETLLDEILSTVQPLATQNANQLEVRALSPLGTICSDRAKLHQAVVSVLANACKFTTQGTITLEVRRDTPEAVSWLDIAIRDTGIGIPPEHMAQLFNDFSQGDTSSTRRYGGVGVGLALSRRLCQMLGGSIQAASVLGTGSTFTLRVPTLLPQTSGDTVLVPPYAAPWP